jgi:hypothetical protein
MVHLTIHLANEARVGRPVQYRWMYPVERFLKKLKDYILNKVKPKGSIVESFLLEECINFYAMYMDNVENRFNQLKRNFDRGYNEINDNSLTIFDMKRRTFLHIEYRMIDLID